MIIGVPKEIKPNETRVAMVPNGAKVLIQQGHEVWIERGAGFKSGFTDEEYAAVGCILGENADEVWGNSKLVIKVKEPMEEEFCFFRENLILITYLHLAANRELAIAISNSGMMAISYETLQTKDGILPLLVPMSEIAGRVSVMAGSFFLQNYYGGKGMLLSGVPGVEQGQVTIIGGGIVGTNAAKMAIGLGAAVTVLDKSVERLRFLDDLFRGRVQTMVSNSWNIENIIKKTDLLVGAVLVPGAKAPKIVPKEFVQKMENGSVIVDVAIDQGGSIETIDRSTTHSDPVYEKFGVIHYAVSNMPAAVARTSTLALTNVTLPFLVELAGLPEKEVALHPELSTGININRGVVVHKAVATSLDLPFQEFTP